MPLQKVVAVYCFQPWTRPIRKVLELNGRAGSGSMDFNNKGHRGYGVVVFFVSRSDRDYFASGSFGFFRWSANEVSFRSPSSRLHT